MVDYLENHEIVKDAAQQTYTVNGKVIDITSTPADLSLGEGDVVCVAPTQQTGDDDSPVDHTPATRTKSATAKGEQKRIEEEKAAKAAAELDREREEKLAKQKREKLERQEREAAAKAEAEDVLRRNAEKREQMLKRQEEAAKRRQAEKRRKKEQHEREAAAKRAKRQVELAAVLESVSKLCLDASADDETLGHGRTMCEKLAQLGRSVKDEAAVATASRHLSSIERLGKERAKLERKRQRVVVGLQRRVRAAAAARRRMQAKAEEPAKSDTTGSDFESCSSDEAQAHAADGADPHSSPVSPLWSPAKPVDRVAEESPSLDGLLSQLGLQSLGPVLEENEVDVEALALMAPDDFAELGIGDSQARELTEACPQPPPAHAWGEGKEEAIAALRACVAQHSAALGGDACATLAACIDGVAEMTSPSN